MSAVINFDDVYVFHYDTHIRCGNGFKINPMLNPIKKTFIPFFKVLGKQIGQQICEITGVTSLRNVEFVFCVKNTNYIGDEYSYGMGHPSVGYIKITQCEHHGKLFKFHKDGYAYAKLDVGNKRELAGSFMWIRWKSLLSTHEYIEADDELPLKSKDIQFEICTEVPDEFLLRLQAKTSEELQLDEWKDMII